VQEMADAAEIWITDEVWDYPGVQALLAACPVEPRTVRFPGIERAMTVLRIGDEDDRAAESESSSPSGE
jgi:hypothetical protein